MSLRIVLLGRTETLFGSAVRARADGHVIAGVITARAAPESTRTEDDYRVLAEECGAPFLLAQRLDERAARLAREVRADVVLSMNWVSVIEQAFIDLFPLGVLNAHFGDLPRYRGNAVPNWAILAGEPEAALTVHQMLGGQLDAGPIFAQGRLALSSETTVGEMNAFMDRSLPELFAEALARLATHAEPLAPTVSEDEGFRCYPRLPRDGRIDWTGTAAQIHALVRASGRPFPGAFTFYRDTDGALRRLSVWRSRVVDAPPKDRGVPGHVIRNDKATGESWVMTGGGVLAIVEASLDTSTDVFAPGRVWKTIRMRLGLDVESEVAELRRELDRVLRLLDESGRRG